MHWLQNDLHKELHKVLIIVIDWLFVLRLSKWCTVYIFISNQNSDAHRKKMLFSTIFSILTYSHPRDQRRYQPDCKSGPNWEGEVKATI